MKYRIIGAAACICILLVSVLNYPVLLTGRMESRRYHQHREATPKAVCAVHAEKEFCTHLPLIAIDTGGAEIPGRGLVDEEDRHMGFTTTAEGADRITAQMRVMDSAEENNHPTDAPAVHWQRRIQEFALYIKVMEVSQMHGIQVCCRRGENILLFWMVMICFRIVP